MLLRLFWSFFQIGLFSFGGGYAALPLIQEQVVYANQWLSATEFVDLITISQMTPGPIAINAATFVGMRLAGFGGAVVATLGCIMPSCIIVSILAWAYFRYQNLFAVQSALNGLRPAVVALIGAAGVSILVSAFFVAGGTDWLNVGLFCAALAVLRIWKPNPIWVMLGCGAAYAAIDLLL